MCVARLSHVEMRSSGDGAPVQLINREEKLNGGSVSAAWETFHPGGAFIS